MNESSYAVLFEEVADFHGCTRSSCTDPMGMSRIALERLISRWPVSEEQPAFTDNEQITVVGVLTRIGYDLIDPEHSQRVLIAYSGTWSTSLGVMWLPGSEGRGYITFEATRGFAPISWYSGHGRMESLQDAAMRMLDALPPLAPTCLDQIDAIPSYEDGDGTICLIVASTHSEDGVRKPAGLYFISGASGDSDLRGVVRSSDTEEGVYVEWIRDFLLYSDGSATIQLGRPLTTDDALRIASLPIDAAWDELAALSADWLAPARITQLETTQTLKGGRILVAPDGWFFDVTAVGFHYEPYHEEEPSLVLTNDGIHAVELRPTWGYIYVIDNYTRDATISFEAKINLMALHEHPAREEARLAATHPMQPQVIELALTIQHQARPPVTTYEDALAELTLWRPSKTNLEFFAAYIELHPTTHPEDWDSFNEAEAAYCGEFDSWSELRVHLNERRDVEAPLSAEEVWDSCDESHGHYFLISKA